MTDPQTAADAADVTEAVECVQTYLDGVDRVAKAHGGQDYVFDAEDIVLHNAMRTLLAARKRMAAELEQVRGELDRRSRLASALRDRRAAADGTAGTGDLRTPEQWCAEYGIDIADPDGWRGRNDPPWDEPITLPDFLRRAARSTTRGLTPDVWNRLSREAHEAADAERSDAEGAGKGPESHGDATDGAPR